MDSIVKENIAALKCYLASMECAVHKAEQGSDAEDGYFLEKLDRMAGRFNKILIQRVHGG